MEPSRVQLDATVTPEGRAVVRLVGELDLADADRVRQALTAMAHHCMSVAVDLAELSFIDLKGIRALDEAQQAAIEKGSRLVLVSPSRCVARLRGLALLGHMRFSEDRSILERGLDRAPRAASLSPDGRAWSAAVRSRNPRAPRRTPHPDVFGDRCGPGGS